MAWIFAGGSIAADTYVPTFTVRPHTREHLERALETARINYQWVRAGSDETTECRPTRDGSVLGRLLAALGAPVSYKSRDADITLPSYLDTAKFVTRLDFARTYVINRGSVRPDRPSTPIQLAEERSVAFRKELKTFLQAVVGEPDAIRGDTTGRGPIHLGTRAALLLAAEPTFGRLSFFGTPLNQA